MAVSRSSALAVNQAKDFVVAGRSFSSSIGPAPNATPAAQRLAIGHQPSDHRTTPVTRDQLGSQPEACVPNFHRISTEWRLLVTVGLHFVESFNSMATLSTKGAPMVNETEHTHTHTHTLEKNVNKNKQTAHWRFLPFYGQGCRPLCPNKVKRVNKAKQNESTETPLVSGRFFFCVDTSTAFYFSLIVLCVCVCVLFPRTESLSLGVDDCKIVLGITAEATRSIRP